MVSSVQLYEILMNDGTNHYSLFTILYANSWRPGSSDKLQYSVHVNGLYSPVFGVERLPCRLAWAHGTEGGAATLV